MGYAVRKDGKGFRAVEFKKDCTKDEIWQENEPDPFVENGNLVKIRELENSITERRKREAILSDDGKEWLADIDAKIEALRNKL